MRPANQHAHAALACQGSHPGDPVRPVVIILDEGVARPWADQLGAHRSPAADEAVAPRIHCDQRQCRRRQRRYRAGGGVGKVAALGRCHGGHYANESGAALQRLTR